jgi:hypothetical protein
LETIRVALSLCYRQLMRIVHVTYRDQEGRQRAPAYYRRKLTDTVTEDKAEAFIDARALGNGGLQRLTESIRRATNSANLVRAIDFLASSYENDLWRLAQSSDSGRGSVVLRAYPKNNSIDILAEGAS